MAGPEIRAAAVGPKKIKLDKLVKYLQKRVDSACPDGELVKSIAADGRVVCAPAGAKTITGVGTSGGLTGGGDEGDVALGVDPSVIKSRFADSFTGNEAVQSIAENGGMSCAAISATGAAGGDLRSIDSVSLFSASLQDGPYPNPRLGGGVVEGRQHRDPPGRAHGADVAPSIPNARLQPLDFDELEYGQGVSFDNDADSLSVETAGTYLVTLYAEWDDNHLEDFPALDYRSSATIVRNESRFARPTAERSIARRVPVAVHRARRGKMETSQGAAVDQAALDEFAKQQRAVWEAGDYATLSQYISHVGEGLVARIGVDPQMRALDVACGTGNAALPAARAGAIVTGLDLTPTLLEAGRQTASAEGLEIEWVEGNAEALPFDSDSFDRVYSTFGHMFAPRHRNTADEMSGVCRDGGVIGICCWTPEGTLGDVFAVSASYMPPPPDFASPPILWGTEDHVREKFDWPRRSGSSAIQPRWNGNRPAGSPSSSWIASGRWLRRGRCWESGSTSSPRTSSRSSRSETRPTTAACGCRRSTCSRSSVCELESGPAAKCPVQERFRSGPDRIRICDLRFRSA